jgi:hypothetical protein
MHENYEIQGTAVSPPTGPLANVSVRGFDADPGIDDPLDSTDTDADGRFELAFGADAIGGPVEGEPEVYVCVYNADTELYTEPIVPSDTTTAVDLVVPTATIESGGTRSSYGSYGTSTGASMSMGTKPGTPTLPYHGAVEHRGITNSLAVPPTRAADGSDGCSRTSSPPTTTSRSSRDWGFRTDP